MNIEEAAEIASGVLAGFDSKERPLAFFARHDPRQDRGWCFVFPWNTRRFIETGNMRDSLGPGHGPIVVVKATGHAWVASSSPRIEVQLARYAAEHGIDTSGGSAEPDESADGGSVTERRQRFENLPLEEATKLPTYPGVTPASVRYRPVSRSGILLGYLWAGSDDNGADFVPRESQGGEAKQLAIAWVGRLAWAFSAGLTPTQMLRYWAEVPEDPRFGGVVPGADGVAESLYALNRLALDVDHVGMVRGSLLGGALGDALGYGVEFSSLAAIRDRFGHRGIAALGPDAGAVSDDTQLTLFVAEGVTNAVVHDADLDAAVFEASQRWLVTQSQAEPAATARGLAAQGWLYARRAPGNACLSGLSAGRMGTMGAPVNPDSKGCGAVMRSAPFGLIPAHDARIAFDNAANCATQTHGHPSGYLAAGAFAALIRLLYAGVRIGDALPRVLELLSEHPGHEEVTTALERAIWTAESGPAPSAEVVETLGQGWVAEEALAIGLYCALVHEPAKNGRPSWAVAEALKLAVNHSGDSDSTGSICGNIMGVIFGQYALPQRSFLEHLEARAEITALADEFAAATAPDR